MTTDMATLIFWIRACLWVAAICTTAFPVLYLFSPWYGSKLGRVVMFQAMSFALAIDLTLVFQYWNPDNILLLFWVNAFVLSFIAAASAGLTFVLWRTNYRHQRWIKETLKK